MGFMKTVKKEPNIITNKLTTKKGIFLRIKIVKDFDAKVNLMRMLVKQYDLMKLFQRKQKETFLDDEKVLQIQEEFKTTMPDQIEVINKERLIR